MTSGKHLTDNQREQIADRMRQNPEVLDFIHAWAMNWYSDQELIEKMHALRVQARSQCRLERNENG